MILADVGDHEYTILYLETSDTLLFLTPIFRTKLRHKHGHISSGATTGLFRENNALNAYI